MANFLSDVLTIRDSKGGISDPGTYLSESKVTRSFFTFSSNPADDDVVLMLDIPSNGKPYSIMLFNDDIGAGSVADYGIYAGANFVDTDSSETEYSKDSVILVNAFADADTLLNSENLDTHQEMRYRTSGTASSLTNADLAMWQLAGLNSDPLVNLRIGIALPTNWSTFVGGSATLITEYSLK